MGDQVLGDSEAEAGHAAGDDGEGGGKLHDDGFHADEPTILRPTGTRREPRAAPVPAGGPVSARVAFVIRESGAEGHRRPWGNKALPKRVPRCA
ncbi:hypothetical protein GCM10027359_05900 [Marilutibacter aestuarii]